MSRHYRKERLDELLFRELTTLIGYELSDPRLGDVAVKRVDVSKDLQTARVYITLLSDEGDEQAALAGLESAKGLIRAEIATRVQLRRVPDLVFRVDRSFLASQRIDAILDALPPVAAGDEGSGP
ncbi:MAG: 30S ribosome-binding factor RbfA [Caldilineales bacterium]|nr:30S ribosome-binding factor RbfA [Caldilineales bacterium]